MPPILTEDPHLQTRASALPLIIRHSD